MFKKIVVAAAVGGAVLGGGAVALAATGTSAPAPSPSSTPATSPAPAAGHAKGKARAAVLGKSFQHGEWVSGKAGKDVTHDAVRGTVSAVSPTSITVKSTDGFTQTYAVASSTKVGERENGKGSAKKGVIGDVKVTDHVLVTGTKDGSALTAVRVMDTGAK